MQDVLYIKDLKVETVIGMFDWEREVRQIVTLDLELLTDIRPAATSENIEDTLDYWSISQRLIQFIGDSQFFLLERLAEEVIAILQNEFGVSWVRLRLGKPGALPQAQCVGLVIERGTR